MTAGSKQNEKVRFKDKVANFLQRHRRKMIIIMATLLGVLIVLITYFEIKKSNMEKSAILIEKAEKDFYDFRSEKDTEIKNKKLTSLSKSLDEIIGLYKGHYAAQRALYLKAELAFEKKDWELAAKTWIEMATQNPTNYLSSIARMNAAISFEEQGNIDKAIEILNALSTSDTDFPEMPRVLFSQGRLNETKQNYQKAVEYYNRLIEEYAASSWTKIARDRILFLKITNKIGK